MNTKALNSLADLICRAQENGKRTPMGIALAIDSAGRHMSPELAAELERLRSQVAELLAERHVTNEALDDAVQARRADRDRIAELEAQREALATRLRAGQEWQPGRSPALVTQDYVSQDELRAMFGIALIAPWDEADGSSVDGLTRLLAPTQALRAPGACDACGSLPQEWCPDCAACRTGCHGGDDGNSCTHPNAPWVRGRVVLEDPHDSPLHHPYRVGRDLPEPDGAR
ncbi:MAG: hypothetical protein HOV82_16910 [Streptomyces sp.]|nr:hypothetical protein [Streptomyces sp.]NUP36228.1 hypothetical protein [Streptomyces sp.]NUS75575.1 hypothetical protein [Streptomyces sp.]